MTEEYTISNVKLNCIEADGSINHAECGLHVQFNLEGLALSTVMQDSSSCDVTINYNSSNEVEITTISDTTVMVKLENNTLMMFTVVDSSDMHMLNSSIQIIKDRRANSVFSQRTEESSASQYFQFYGYLSQQQNMMQDFVRTSTYQKAIHTNLSDFQDKVILDVGAGSGILSFFALQAGANKVYAVEASNMAQYAQQLVDANNLSDRIRVVAGKIEEIDLPEKVDIIISEPMGYMLYNERMLETYLHAKKWLKPGGKMFPSRGDLHVVPFSDEALYMEQSNKSNFWCQNNFHGVDLSSVRQAAMREYFRQPIVDTFDMRICMSRSERHTVNFLEADEKDLHRISIPLNYHILETGSCHGLAFWFDVEFAGSSSHVWLSTSPTEPLTHWYQVRCLLQNPLCVKSGQLMTGNVLLVANKRQSYDVTIELAVEGTALYSTNTLDLKNPYFRYTGVQAPIPPGSSTVSPSEQYWSQLDAQGARNAVNLVNGMHVNGLGEVASMDQQQYQGNFSGHPSIHPGCISSTGRNRVNSGSSSSNQQQNMVSTITMGGGNLLATSTQNAAQQQLIGGAISPSLFVNSVQLPNSVQQQHLHQNQQPLEYLKLKALSNEVAQILNGNAIVIQNHLRINASTFKKIVELMPDVVYDWGKEYELLVLLYWMAVGCSYREAGVFLGVSPFRVKSIIHNMLEYFVQYMRHIIKPPADEEQEEIGARFCTISKTSIFRNVVGAIDGCHIKISYQGTKYDEYLNNKNFHSIQCQAVVNSNYLFNDVFVGYPGSVDDTTIFLNSSLSNNSNYTRNNCFILGDSAYPCQLSPIAVITPYKNPVGIQKQFNAVHGRAHNVVECAFSILKMRWRNIFNKPIELKIENCIKTVFVACVLHNICVSGGDIGPTSEVDAVVDDSNSAEDDMNISDEIDSTEAIVFRDMLMNQM